MRSYDDFGSERYGSFPASPLSGDGRYLLYTRSVVTGRRAGAQLVKPEAVLADRQTGRRRTFPGRFVLGPGSLSSDGRHAVLARGPVRRANLGFYEPRHVDLVDLRSGTTTPLPLPPSHRYIATAAVDRTGAHVLYATALTASNRDKPQYRLFTTASRRDRNVLSALFEFNELRLSNDAARFMITAMPTDKTTSVWIGRPGNRPTALDFSSHSFQRAAMNATGTRVAISCYHVGADVPDGANYLFLYDVPTATWSRLPLDPAARIDALAVSTTGAITYKGAGGLWQDDASGAVALGAAPPPQCS